MSCCLSNQVLTHYVGESKTYYADLGEAIRGRTITGVTAIVSDDAALTLSGLAVVSVDTSEANTGVSWTMAGGTAGSDDDEFTATLRVTFTTSAGTEQARVRVQVVNALP